MGRVYSKALLSGLCGESTEKTKEDLLIEAINNNTKWIRYSIEFMAALTNNSKNINLDEV